MSLTVRPGNALLSLSFAADLDAIRTELPAFMQRRIPSIARNALNDTIGDARFAEIDKIRGVFDRPTPFTQQAVLYERATVQGLTARIYIRDDATRGTAPIKYLAVQVSGGMRGAKRFEQALRAIGVMAPGEFAIPAIGYARDAYGNLPGPLLVRILSQLRAFNEVGFKANETATSRKRNAKRVTARYFAVRSLDAGKRGLAPGVYERRGRTVRAVLVFVSRAPTYRPRYDFGQAAKAKAERVFGRYFERHFYRELGRMTAMGPSGG